MIKRLRRWGGSGFTIGVAAAYLFSNVVAAYAQEQSLWSSRRFATQKFQGDAEGTASLGETAPRDLHQLLAQLPEAARLDLGGNPSPKSQPEKSIAGPFSPGPKMGDWLGKLVLPHGWVRHVYLSPTPSAPVVLHIQDGHGIEDAQRNIAAMIGLLAEQPGVALVGLEGAAGPVDLAPYRDFSDPSITQDIADFFLQKGLIAGPEYAGLTLPNAPSYFGAEDAALYAANVQALKVAYRSRPEALTRFDSLNQAAEKLKSVHYSQDLKTFDRHFNAYNTDQEPLGEYVRFLTQSLVPNAKHPPLPNIKLVLQALGEEEALQFSRVEAERQRLIDRLAQKITPKTLNDLVAKSVDYRAGRLGYGDYNAHLRRTCETHGIALAQFPQLTRYMRYVALAEKIERNPLIQELALLEQIVPESLAKTPQERSLTLLSRDLALLGKLLRLELSHADWTAYAAQRADIARMAGRVLELDPSQQDLHDFRAEELKPFEDFCLLATRRNGALVDNLLGQMAGQKTAVLVAGGFHTDGLTSLLREKQISYVVVTPHLQQPTEPNDYLDILAKDPLPLEHQLAGDRISLSKPIALADPNGETAKVLGGIQQIFQLGLRFFEFSKGLAITTDGTLGNKLGEFDIGERTVFIVKDFKKVNPLQWVSSFFSSNLKNAFGWTARLLQNRLPTSTADIETPPTQPQSAQELTLAIHSLEQDIKDLVSLNEKSNQTLDRANGRWARLIPPLGNFWDRRLATLRRESTKRFGPNPTLMVLESRLEALRLDLDIVNAGRPVLRDLAPFLAQVRDQKPLRTRRPSEVAVYRLKGEGIEWALKKTRTALDSQDLASEARALVRASAIPGVQRLDGVQLVSRASNGPIQEGTLLSEWVPGRPVDSIPLREDPARAMPVDERLTLFSDDHIQAFVKTVRSVMEAGIAIDASHAGNILYDSLNGFTLIDLSFTGPSNAPAKYHPLEIELAAQRYVALILSAQSGKFLGTQDEGFIQEARQRVHQAVMPLPRRQIPAALIRAMRRGPTEAKQLLASLRQNILFFKAQDRPAPTPLIETRSFETMAREALRETLLNGLDLGLRKKLNSDLKGTRLGKDYWSPFATLEDSVKLSLYEALSETPMYAIPPMVRGALTAAGYQAASSLGGATVRIVLADYSQWTPSDQDIMAAYLQGVKQYARENKDFRLVVVVGGRDQKLWHKATFAKALFDGFPPGSTSILVPGQEGVDSGTIDPDGVTDMALVDRWISSNRDRGLATGSRVIALNEAAVKNVESRLLIPIQTLTKEMEAAIQHLRLILTQA